MTRQQQKNEMQKDLFKLFDDAVKYELIANMSKQEKLEYSIIEEKIVNLRNKQINFVRG